MELRLWFILMTFCFIARPDLELRLDLNEDPGATTYSDSSGKNRDASCTSGNCPTVVSAGIFGSGVSFDGTDDGLEVPDNDIFSPSLNDLTACVWFLVPVGAGNGGNGERGGSGAYLLAKGSGSQWEWAIENDSDTKVVYNTWQLDGNEHLKYYTSLTLDDNGYHQACIKVDAGVRVDGFLDGKLMGSDTTVSGSMGNGTSALYVGRRGDGNYFEGHIFQVSVWDYFLSRSEIRALYRLVVGKHGTGTSFHASLFMGHSDFLWPFGS